ncbi:hypothetical protein AAG906_013103 [Vitis piasezkii]
MACFNTSKEAGIGPLSWVPRDREVPRDKEVTRDREDKGSSGSNSISTLKKVGETHLIVTALVATVTFAAGFTLPGERSFQSICCRGYFSHGFLCIRCICLLFMAGYEKRSFSTNTYLGAFSHHCYHHGAAEDGSRAEIACMDDTLYKAAAEGRETHLIVAALTATVTFAAGFTLTGGYCDKESIFQSICCVRYHSDDPLSRCCMVLFSYGNGLSFGWESAWTLLSMWLYSHRVWDGSHLLLQLFPCWLCCNLKRVIRNVKQANNRIME